MGRPRCHQGRLAASQVETYAQTTLSSSRAPKRSRCSLGRAASRPSAAPNLDLQRGLGITPDQRFRFASLMRLAADDAGLPDDPEPGCVRRVRRVGHAARSRRLPPGAQPFERHLCRGGAGGSAAVQSLGPRASALDGAVGQRASRAGSNSPSTRMNATLAWRAAVGPGVVGAALYDDVARAQRHLGVVETRVISPSSTIP